MIRKFLTVPLLFIATSSFSQLPKDIIIGLSADLMKTDNNTIFNKAQIGLEGNYFFTRSFTVTGGMEVWTSDGVSLVSGIRWYPVEEAFLRARALVGENDFSIGGGWTSPINASLKFEAIGDFYFKGEFSIRAGIVYIIRRQ